MFRFAQYQAQCVSHNIQWVSAHNSFIIASPLKTFYGRGTFLEGVCLGVNIENMVEWDELYNGYEVTDQDLFLLKSAQVNGTGTSIGTGITEDVDNFAFVAFIGLADFQGQHCSGETGGGNTGGTYYVFDDWTANNRPPEKYATYSQEFDCKFTTDYTGIWDSGDDQDPSTKTELASHALEITSPLEGNFWLPRFTGGNNRTTLLHIDDFVFPMNTTRHNYITDMWCLFYFPTNSKLTDIDKTISSKKAIVAFEIPKQNEVYQISRDYLLGNNMGNNDNLTFSTVGLPLRNSIRTMPNWCTILDKYTDDFTQAEKDYIFEYGRPKEFQVGDEFKLCSWIVVDDATGLSKGDSVTGDTSGATATVERVEQVRYTNRVVLKGASTSFNNDTTINGGSYTITSASDYNPTQVYKCMRKQRGGYPSTNLLSVVDYNGDTWNYYGAGDYAKGINRNSSSKDEKAYQWSYLMLDINLPDGVNGGGADGDKSDPTLYIEVVTSLSEYLLDGQSRRGLTNYRGVPKYANNYITCDVFNRVRNNIQGGNGYGLAMAGANDNSINGFKSQGWLSSSDTNFNVSYTRAEMSWYFRSPDNWQRTAYRQQLGSESNSSNYRPAGKTSYSTDNLFKDSKGYTLINVSGLGNIFETEKASSAEQFDDQQTVYNDNPSYVPQYAINEEMLPPTESAPYVPKVRLYGQRPIDWFDSQINEYTNTTGNTILKDTDVNNAPDLPKTIRDILATLPS